MDLSLAPRRSRASEAKLWIVAVLGLTVCLGAPLAAQHPAELSREAKIGIFVQQLVKIARVDPEKFSSLVLEYELGQALREMELLASDAAHQHDEGVCRHAACAHERDFIESAVAELEPRLAEARTRAESDPAAARAALGEIVSGNEEGTRANPYVRTYARWQLAELGYRDAVAARAEGDERAAARFEEVMTLCEEINRDERLFLVPDYRVCELIALSLRELARPLLESAQYALLLTDYPYLPPSVEARARARLAELQEVASRPIGKVASWMDDVEGLISKEITGEEPTQVKERQILTALDKLIELQEARERQVCKNCGSGG